jgi:transcriptional regulator with XRE-family HTH domain
LLGERLRVLRARRGETISEASLGAGVQRHTLRELELDQRTPTNPTLHKLASYYGVPVENLMFDEESVDPKDLGSFSGADTVESLIETNERFLRAQIE